MPKSSQSESQSETINSGNLLNIHRRMIGWSVSGGIQQYERRREVITTDGAGSVGDLLCERLLMLYSSRVGSK